MLGLAIASVIAMAVGFILTALGLFRAHRDEELGLGTALLSGAALICAWRTSTTIWGEPGRSASFVMHWIGASLLSSLVFYLLVLVARHRRR